MRFRVRHLLLLMTALCWCFFIGTEAYHWLPFVTPAYTSFDRFGVVFFAETTLVLLPIQILISIHILRNEQKAVPQ